VPCSMEQELNKFIEADEKGDYTASLRLSSFLGRCTQETSSQRSAPQSVHIVEAAEKFIKTKKQDKAWKEQSATDMENRLKFFLDFAGKKTLKSITRDEVRNFRDILQKIPPQYKKNKNLGAVLDNLCYLGQPLKY